MRITFDYHGTKKSFEVSLDQSVEALKALIQTEFQLNAFRFTLYDGKRPVLFDSDDSKSTLADIFSIFTPDLLNTAEATFYVSFVSDKKMRQHDRHGMRLLAANEYESLAAQTSNLGKLICPLSNKLIEHAIKLNGYFYEAKNLAEYLVLEIKRCIALARIQDPQCLNYRCPKGQAISWDFIEPIIDYFNKESRNGKRNITPENILKYFDYIYAGTKDQIEYDLLIYLQISNMLTAKIVTDLTDSQATSAAPAPAAHIGVLPQSQLSLDNSSSVRHPENGSATQQATKSSMTKKS